MCLGSPPNPWAAGYQTLAGEAAHATLPTLNESRSTEDAAEDASPGRASTTSASESEDETMMWRIWKISREKMKMCEKMLFSALPQSGFGSTLVCSHWSRYLNFRQLIPTDRARQSSKSSKIGVVFSQFSPQVRMLDYWVYATAATRWFQDSPGSTLLDLLNIVAFLKTYIYIYVYVYVYIYLFIYLCIYV